MRYLNGLIAIIAFLALGYFGWDQRSKRIEADKAAATAQLKLDLAATRLLEEAFTARGDLRVARLTGRVSTPSNVPGIIFKPSQVTVAPFAVNYFIDLSKIRRDSFAFDASKGEVVIRIPDVSVERPTVDMENAQIRQDGLFISRGDGVLLARKGAENLRQNASQRAGRSVRIKAARESGRRQIAQLAEGMYGAVDQKVKVVVQYPWEAGRSDEQWERSKSVGEVYNS